MTAFVFVALVWLANGSLKQEPIVKTFHTKAACEDARSDFKAAIKDVNDGVIGNLRLSYSIAPCIHLFSQEKRNWM